MFEVRDGQFSEISLAILFLSSKFLSFIGTNYDSIHYVTGLRPTCRAKERAWQALPGLTLYFLKYSSVSS